MLPAIVLLRKSTLQYLIPTARNWCKFSKTTEMKYNKYVKTGISAICALAVLLLCSCTNELVENNPKRNNSMSLVKYENIIGIDSTYTYPGDSLYNLWLTSYNNREKDALTTKSLSPEDDAFFNKKHIVKSTEAMLLYGRQYIYPGSILEGNSISDQKYVPVFLQNRNPITVSMTLSHKKPKHTSRTIKNLNLSKFNDYVKEIVVDGSFQQNEKFMFQQKRFTFPFYQIITEIIFKQ